MRDVDQGPSSNCQPDVMASSPLTSHILHAHFGQIACQAMWNLGIPGFGDRYEWAND